MEKASGSKNRKKPTGSKPPQKPHGSSSKPHPKQIQGSSNRPYPKQSQQLISRGLRDPPPPDISGPPSRSSSGSNPLSESESKKPVRSRASSRDSLPAEDEDSVAEGSFSQGTHRSVVGSGSGPRLRSRSISTMASNVVYSEPRSMSRRDKAGSMASSIDSDPPPRNKSYSSTGTEQIEKGIPTIWREDSHGRDLSDFFIDKDVLHVKKPATRHHGKMLFIRDWIDHHPFTERAEVHQNVRLVEWKQFKPSELLLAYNYAKWRATTQLKEHIYLRTLPGAEPLTEPVTLSTCYVPKS